MKYPEVHFTLVAGAVLELLGHEFINHTENNVIVVTKPLDDDFVYLKPPYD